MENNSSTGLDQRFDSSVAEAGSNSVNGCSVTSRESSNESSSSDSSSSELFVSENENSAMSNYISVPPHNRGRVTTTATMHKSAQKDFVYSGMTTSLSENSDRGNRARNNLIPDNKKSYNMFYINTSNNKWLLLFKESFEPNLLNILSSDQNSITHFGFGLLVNFYK
nr:hypothetical protein MACL_00002320 [Theileria orientalis]